MEKRQESFVFYASFYEALQGCPDDIRLDVYEAVIRYAVYGDEPAFDGVRRSLFVLIKPQIDANIRRRENGSRGGRKKAKDESNRNQTEPKPNRNQTQTKTKPKPNQDVTEVEPNVNVNDNVNVNEVMLTHNVTTRKQRFDAWLQKECPYIAKRYKLPTDEQLERLCSQYGEQMVAEVCGQLENRADLRKRYTDLYRTLLNWCKREKEHGERRFNESAGQRADEYASVIAEFRNSSGVRQS